MDAENDKTSHINFDEYIRQGEPDKRSRANIWRVAIGLQAVDGLKTSAYLQETARRNIEGHISIDEAKSIVNQYYTQNPSQNQSDAAVEEADRVSANIAKVLSQNTFTFNTNGFISIHRRVFEGVLKHAGELRKYNITKNEWVLEGDTVRYLNWEDLRQAIDFDLAQERSRTYSGKSTDEMIAQISSFVSGLWQIHPFAEGNTRTTAVFTIQYLRSLGFDVNNDLFAKHSWYFRNALVRANYKNALKGIEYTPIYLERFFRNLLLGEQWDLRNRYLHIQPTNEWKTQPNLDTRQVTRQVPDKSPDKLPDKLICSSQYINSLLLLVGLSEMSIKEMLESLGLKNRESFMYVYLNPAIKEKYIKLLYPNTPRHPRQKYKLTTKGIKLYNKLNKTD